VDQNGKLRPDGRICWSEAPAEVVIQKPYALALLPRFVEVDKYLVSNFLVIKNKFQAIFIFLLEEVIPFILLTFCRFDLSELHIH
jgi:uncharacterized membrane protein